MSMAKKIVNRIAGNDYVFSIIARVIGVVLAFILSILTARYFNPDLKGVSAVIDNDVSLYAVFLGLGMYQAYPFYKKNKLCDNVFDTFVNHFFTLFCFYQFLAIAISLILFKVGGHELLSVAILLMPAEVYIKQLNYIVLIEHPRRRNINSIIISASEVFIIALMWGLIPASKGAAIAFVCIARAINLALSFINLRVNPMKLKFQVDRLYEFAKFGIIPMFVLLCMTINYKIDIQMLKLFRNVSYADIGIYSVGVSLANKIWLIPDAMKDILLSKLVAGKKEDEVAKVLRLNLAISVAAILALLIIGKPAIVVLFGKDYENSFYVMLLMMIGVLGMVFYKMIYSYNISCGKRTINLVFLGSASIVNVIGNYFLIPRFGIWGAAFVSIISYNVCGLAFLFYFHNVSKIGFLKLLFIQKEDIKQLKSILKK